MAQAYLVGTATQGSADAFVQSEIATALTGLSRVAFRVREILIEVAGPITLSSEVSVAISRRTKAAMPSVSDRDVIMKQQLVGKFSTSGLVVYPGVHRYTYDEDDEVLIVEDPLYLILDSTGTSIANVVNARIGYERASISDVDRLTLLTQSLD